jgi:pyrimidine-nucleoside phosphorylase
LPKELDKLKTWRHKSTCHFSARGACYTRSPLPGATDRLENAMRAVDILRKKRDGQALSAAEIEAFVNGVTRDEWPDYQASALLMATFLRGMTADETAVLTRAMVNSGVKLDLSDIPGPKVDKHSTGGVGDKTSLVLAPLAAACGVVVPMMSGRGLGHSGGTLDKLESIPGFRVGLSLDQFRAALRQVGCALIGQTEEIAPADKRLYALRDVTATVESIPLITASIMSKKIAEGIDGLVLDVKCGQGAFMKKREDARALAHAFITAMQAPLGRTVGNALEVAECIATLKGQGPSDLTYLSVILAARMLVLAHLVGNMEEAQVLVRAALTSGRGLQKFGEIIAQQGGDPRVLDDPTLLPAAPHRSTVRAERSGHVATINAELVGRASMLLGAGRDRVEDAIDHAVGVVVKAAVGHQVKVGDPLVEVHYRDTARLEAAAALLREAWRITDSPPGLQGLLLDTVV